MSLVFFQSELQITLPCKDKHKKTGFHNLCYVCLSNERAAKIRTFCHNFLIITNLIHKFLVHSHKLYKIKFFYMFRAQSTRHQEVNDVNCTYADPGIVTLCTCMSTIYVVDLLMMSGLGSKHVEELNFI
jgi:hypothetical protein